MRQIILDTETTGLEPAEGHRIIEIGCVELVNRRYTRRHFHHYINPERDVERGALEVHGLDNDFLAKQPRFDEIAPQFLEFVRDAELVIHNAEFDIAFLDAELERLGGAHGTIRDCCSVLDTLSMARQMHPGQRNSLDALAKRYDVDNSKRELHGALLDAQILAEIYLAMTGGQVSLSLDAGTAVEHGDARSWVAVERDGLTLCVVTASDEERAAHDAMLERMREHRGGPVLWDTPPAIEASDPSAVGAASSRE
jgi:DNA polymerase-3 subunit epsilon